MKRYERNFINHFGKQGITITIDKERYYGTEYFLLKEDYVNNILKEAIDNIFFKELSENMIEIISNNLSTPANIEEKEIYIPYLNKKNIKVIELSKGNRKVTINKYFYDYFVGIGLTFKIGSSKKAPVRLYKGSECVGIVLPIVRG